MPEAVKWFRDRKLSDDLYRLPALLEGTRTKFSEDAELLARAILDGRTEAAYGAADEILEHRLARPETSQ